MSGTAIKVELDGRERTLYRQQDVDEAGGFWATSGVENADKGIALYGDGKAYRETFREGELKTRVYLGEWRLLPSARARTAMTLELLDRGSWIVSTRSFAAAAESDEEEALLNLVGQALQLRREGYAVRLWIEDTTTGEEEL